MPKTNDIGQVHFKHKDITRHSLVTKIVKAYESNQRETKR
jgi:phosphate starvation-inducible protein PhoH